MQTFVVRVWTPASAPPASGEPAQLRGVVEHPASGEHTTFTEDDELLAFLQKLADLAEARTGRGEAP